jgi:hypothetical protein
MLIPVFGDMHGVYSTCPRLRGHGTQHTNSYTIQLACTPENHTLEGPKKGLKKVKIGVDMAAAGLVH